MYREKKRSPASTSFLSRLAAQPPTQSESDRDVRSISGHGPQNLDASTIFLLTSSRVVNSSAMPHRWHPPSALGRANAKTCRNDDKRRQKQKEEEKAEVLTWRMLLASGIEGGIIGSSFFPFLDLKTRSLSIQHASKKRKRRTSI
eukprot:2578409-Rhodomonas_salina.1